MSTISLNGDTASPRDTSYMENAKHPSDAPLDEVRIEELRRRIVQRFYSDPDVIRIVAKRLVDDWRNPECS